MNSVSSAGLQGVMQSQQAMQQHAHNIATAPSDVGVPNSGAAATNTFQPANPVNETSTVSDDRSKTDIAQELISMRQQAQVFTASANVVAVGDEAVGSLIDDYS